MTTSSVQPAADVAPSPGRRAVTAFDYPGELGRMVLLCQILLECDADTCALILERAHTVGPLLYPSEYLRGLGNLESASTVIGAVRAAQQLLRRDPQFVAACEALKVSRRVR